MTSIDVEQPAAGRPRGSVTKWILVGGAAALAVAAVVAVALIVLPLGGDERTIRFEVSAEGAEIARIGYGTNGTLHVLRPQKDGTDLPWSIELEVPEGSSGVLLSVRTVPRSAGTVSCRLLRGDRVVIEATDPARVTCGARIEELFGE